MSLQTNLTDKLGVRRGQTRELFGLRQHHVRFAGGTLRFHRYVRAARQRVDRLPGAVAGPAALLIHFVALLRRRQFAGTGLGHLQRRRSASHQPGRPVARCGNAEAGKIPQRHRRRGVERHRRAEAQHRCLPDCHRQAHRAVPQPGHHIARRAAHLANGIANLNYSGVSYFTNGADTRTRGIDFVASLRSEPGNAGTLQTTLSVNYNKN